MKSLAVGATPLISMCQPDPSQPSPAQESLPQSQQFSPGESAQQVEQIQPQEAVLKGPGGCMPDNFYDGPKTGQQWQALFSTDEGKRPKRPLEKPYPPPILHSDLHKDCSTKADDLISQFPRLSSAITIPNSWDEVYKWFDAYDLYVEGAKHCMNVLQEIGRRNASQKRSEEDQAEKIIAIYADEWMIAHNDQILQSPRDIDIFALFWPEEQLDHNVDAKHIKSLRNHLEQRRRLLQSIPPYTQALYPVREGSPAVIPFSPVLTTAIPLHPVTYHQSDTRSSQKTFSNPDQILCQQQVSGGPNSASLPQSQGQRQLSGGSSSSGPLSRSRQPIWDNQPQGRHRGKSSDFSQNCSFPLANSNRRLVNQNGRTVSNTPGPSPRHYQEPVHYNTENPQQSSPAATFGGHHPSKSGHFRHGSISNDAHTPPSRGYYNRGHDQYEHRERYNGPGNMREVMQGDRHVLFNSTDHPTYFYAIAPKRFTEIEIYEREPRTARAENLPKKLFLSHKLKEMMSTCGEVQTIHYLNDGSHACGCALITFNEKSCVEAAIRKFNSTPLEDGLVLHITGYERGFKNPSRSRANSQFSQGSHGYNRRDSFTQGINCNKPGHRYSINRPPSGNYSQYGGPNIHPAHFDSIGWAQHINANGIATLFNSATSEGNQHRPALDRLPAGKPLISIENILTTPKMPEYQAGGFSLSENFSKENSPIKIPDKDTDVDGHHADNANENRYQGSVHGAKKRGKSKGSKQNTSTRPTPAPSPTKHQSSPDLVCMACEPRHVENANSPRSSNYLIGLGPNRFEANQIVTQQLPMDRALKSEHFKAWKQEHQAKVIEKSPSDSTYSLLLSTEKSFLIGANSEPSASPKSGVTSAGGSFAARSNLSASNCSSRHDPSVVIVKSEVNLPATAFEQDHTKANDQQKPAEKMNRTQHSKKHKNVPKSNGKHTSNKGSRNDIAESDRAVAPPQRDDHGHNGGRSCGDDVYGVQSKKSHKDTGLVEGFSRRATPEKVLKHIKSTTNLQKINSAATVDKKFETGFLHDRSLANGSGSIEQKLKKGGHAKKPSALSATCSSTRKSDAKGSRAVSDFNGDSSSKTNTPRKSKSAESLLSGSLTDNLEVGNFTSWPALGPSISPQSSIADGKRPPPIFPSINTARHGTSRLPPRPTSANGTVIPAVPNIARKPRPQS